MRLTGTFIFLLWGFCLMAQTNLVPNPGFEPSEKNRPSTAINLEGKPMQALVEGWYIPTAGTTDFYNSDRSTFEHGLPVKKARTGQGRIGLIVNSGGSYGGEYVQARLNQPLGKNKKYCVTIHFALDKRCHFYSESIGMAFTNGPIGSRGTGYLYDINLIRAGVVPLLFNNEEQNKNTQGWQEARQVYEAAGGEEYITIGSFENVFARATTDEDPAHNPGLTKGLFGRLAYYYFDDISVVEVSDDSLCRPARTIAETIPPLNHFVFLVDVSASMAKAGYLQQLKGTIASFIDTLGPNDRVSLMTFDLRTHVLLRNTNAAQKNTILQAIDHLQAGTVTNVDKAITRAYELMDNTLLQFGDNKVVLVSDAVFELSKESRNIIQNHYTKKQVCFSIVQFGDQRNKTLDKLTRQTSGIYAHSKDEDILNALSKQVRKTGADDYTPARPGKAVHTSWSMDREH